MAPPSVLRLWQHLAVLATAVAANSALFAQAPTTRYDVYVVGVRVAELTVRGSGNERMYTIRTKDRAANTWSSAHSATDQSIQSDTSFRLPGAIRNVAANIASIGRVDWSAHDLIGWPNRSSVYERASELETTVDGVTRKAVRWNRRDTSRPMDIIVGADNALIAAIDPPADVVLVRRGYEALTTVGAWMARDISPAKFGYRALGKQLVPMPDGVRLATLVYLPSADAGEKFPTIFVRTPYGITGLIGGFWHYAARGFAVVLQAARGTSYGDPAGLSEGALELMVNEPNDGQAALDWIAKQPWSDGKICMQGGSYVAYTQWTAAMSGNPALKCLVPESSMGTAFADQPYVGGGMLVGMAYYTFFMHNQPLLPTRTWTDVLAHRPLIDLDQFATGRNIPNWDQLVLNATNGAYWKRQDWHHARIRPELATLQISGWFDDDLPGTMSNWALMQRIGKAPQRLVLGPWKHGYNTDRMLNGYSYGLDALRDDIWLIKQRWYDSHLKGIDNGVSAPRVEYFVLGDNRWRSATAWPPTEVTPQTWYFHGDGRANRLVVAGRLDQQAPLGDEPLERYTYDPKDPPPNWMSFEQMQRWEDVQTFQWDMKDLESRHDVVTFTSAPLPEDLTIAGDVLAVLYASTDVKDTDWWVHISDVDLAGRSNRLTLGSLRARFRQLQDPRFRGHGSNFETEHLLSGNPADVVKYEIGIRGVANTFKKGHRIRVAIMNALDNYTFPNSNTGGDEARVTETIAGSMAIHHTRLYPSHVVLPVLPH
ncbi:MAG: CocE/NonD family hydrolase [Gemmatimonadaceae bacterium]